MASGPRLGKVLARCAFGPLNYAGSLVMASRVPEALNELTPENLHGGLVRGVDETAKLAGVRPSDVNQLLPTTEIDGAAQSLGASQRAALAAWHRHAGSIGGLLTGVADLTHDGRVPDVPLCLERLAKKVSRDKEFAAPLRALAADIERWQDLMTRCTELLDDGGVLARAYRMRRIRTVAMGVALGLAVAVVVTFALRVRAAHQRVEDKLVAAASAPCAVAELTDDELGRGTSEQNERAATLKNACTAERERAAKTKAERDAKEAADKAVRDAKEAHERACASLEAHVSSAALDDADRSAAGASAPLLERISKSALTADDLGPNDPDLPCKDTPAGAALAEAFGVAVMKGPWAAGGPLGGSARAAIVKHAGDLSVAQRVNFSKHADTIAKLAIVGGKTDLMTQAATQCALAGDLGFAPRAYCPGAIKLSGSPRAEPSPSRSRSRSVSRRARPPRTGLTASAFGSSASVPRASRSSRTSASSRTAWPSARPIAASFVSSRCRRRTKRSSATPISRSAARLTASPPEEGPVRIIVVFADQQIEATPIAAQVREISYKQRKVNGMDLRAPGTVTVESIDFLPAPDP